MKFKCKYCNSHGDIALIVQKKKDFALSRWYRDPSGFNHEIIFCNNCGSFFDVKFSILKLLVYPIFKNPYKIIGHVKFIDFVNDVTNKENTTGRTPFEIVTSDYSFNSVIAEYIPEFINTVIKNNNKKDGLTACFPNGVIYD